MSLINGLFTPINILPPLHALVGEMAESEPVLGLCAKGAQVVVQAYSLTGKQEDVRWNEVGAAHSHGESVSDLIGWMYLPGSACSPVQPSTSPVPITESHVYSAVLEACVQAEASDQSELAKVLRAWVDASPFEGCPTGCNGQQPRRGEAPCGVCQGTGFIPEV